MPSYEFVGLISLLAVPVRRLFPLFLTLYQAQAPADFFSNLTHLQAMLLFAALVSVAFGFVSRRRVVPRVKYILWSFALFVLIGIAVGWIMYPFSR